MNVTWVASSAGVGRRAKRDTVHALGFIQRFGNRHCGDGVILLVGLRNYDAHLSVTLIYTVNLRISAGALISNLGEDWGAFLRAALIRMGALILFFPNRGLT